MSTVRSVWYRSPLSSEGLLHHILFAWSSIYPSRIYPWINDALAAYLYVFLAYDIDQGQQAISFRCRQCGYLFRDSL